MTGKSQIFYKGDKLSLTPIYLHLLLTTPREKNSQVHTNLNIQEPFPKLPVVALNRIKL